MPTSTTLQKPKLSPERGTDIAAITTVVLYLLLFAVLYTLHMAKPVKDTAGEPYHQNKYKYFVTVKRVLI